jgi:FlaA1/EpsC-like NDP-sugar epimerase
MDRLATRMVGRSRIPVAMVLLMAGDVLALLGAIAVSLMLRFDSSPFPHVYDSYLASREVSTAIGLACYVAVFAMFRLYRYAWRFASLETVRGVVCACTVGLLCLIMIQRIVDGSVFPISALIILWMTSMLLVGGIRILLRIASLSQRFGSQAVKILQRDLAPKRVVILGGGSAGVQVLDSLRSEGAGSYEVIGFLDDNPNKRGIYIRDVQVLGPLKGLYELLDDKAVDEVLIALPDAAGEEIRGYVMACRKQKVRVKVIPGLNDMLNGKNSVRIEDISVEDLLRRPPVEIDLVEIGDFLTGKRILVTGAGGSIGSELCRQIVRLNPSTLVLLGHGENSIHRIHQELRHSYPAMANRLRMVIASVADEVRINQVFQEHKPQVVFHAAAHKHVPIMEMNVLEAIQNNVLGTCCVADACGRFGVKCMVLISTDKAVYPSSVMGATKWLCEKLVRAMTPIYRDTNYVTVRFGNVLGSRGSVLPLFHTQIMRGGPVTVTHPEMTRYFMSIPEAVQLVLQAGAVGRSGELYLLDMGKPVRILDLAHDMIRLCGYEPDVDIPVVYTGPRPGEKLHERLVAEGEIIEPAYGEGMSIVRCPDCFSTTEMMEAIRECRQIVSRGDPSDAYDFLGKVIPEMLSQTLIGRQT